MRLPILILSLLLLMQSLGAAAQMTSRTVSITHDSRRLVASLDLAEGRALADGVVLVVHGTMGHRDMDVMRRLRALLGERGHSTLAPTLSLGVDGREGMYDCAVPSRHRAEDSAAEIAAWVGWARQQGARRVVLLGFSRGGQQSAWYLAQTPQAPVDRLVLLAPIFAGDLAAGYESRFRQPLAPLLDRARRLVEAGRGDELLPGVGFLNCESTSASAAALLSYYAPPPQSEPDATLPRIGVPTLVVVAGGDIIARDLEQRLGGRLAGRHRLTVISGADHFFHDLYGEDAADEIGAFLRP